MRTLLRGLAVATSLALAPVAAATVVAAPAHAATYSTTVTLDPDIKKAGFHGDFFSITADVEDSEGNGPFAGTSYLQRLAPGSSTWKNVASDDSPGFSYFPSYDEFRGNARFRVVYVGATYNPGPHERVYTSSVSKVITIRTARNIDGDDVSNRRAVRVKTTVKPSFGGKKILVQKKQGGKFKTIRKAKTNKRGVVVVSVPGSRRGIRYRLVAPGDRNYVSSTLTFTARVY